MKHECEDSILSHYHSTDSAPNEGDLTRGNYPRTARYVNVRTREEVARTELLTRDFTNQKPQTRVGEMTGQDACAEAKEALALLTSTVETRAAAPT